MFAHPTRPLPSKAAIQPGFAFSLDVILSGRQAAKDLARIGRMRRSHLPLTPSNQSPVAPVTLTCPHPYVTIRP
jgi:hypothetical protein